MADQKIAQGMDNQWRTQQFRQKVVAQIEEAMRQSGNPITKSSTEMEQHVFNKAHSREEYLALVARLIIHVREINSKTKKGDPGMGPGGLPGGPMAGHGQQPHSMQNPIDALSSLTRNGPATMGPQGMVPGQQMVPGPMMPGGQPFQSYGPRGMQQQMQQQMQPMGPMGPIQGMPNQGMRQDFMQSAGPGPGMAPQQQLQQMSGQLQPQQQFNMSMGQPGMMGQQGQQPTMSMSQPASSAGAGAPSPASNTISLVTSPAMISISSPSSIQAQITPSPASRAFTGAPSPGNALSTPSGPGSVGPAPSPSSLTANEEQAYLAKWKQLQIYIEPLKRMINKMVKDEDRKNMNKMKNLLDILSDSSKRVSMNALSKCEQVLQQNFREEAPSKAGSDLLPSTKSADTHMCQTLMDAVASQIKSPMLNHTLHRTFGPAVQALHGPPIQVPSPPAKRQKVDTDEASEPPEISSLLQGEVARLNERFRVTLDQRHHPGSKTIHLMCHLSDKYLPSVPPISVIIPEDYPHNSPTCDASPEEYDTTPFLQKVLKLLNAQLLQLPDRFALTALLNTWEMSVRRACNPASG